MNSKVAELDEEDLELVHALQIGPRLPWTALGEILDRHPTSLAARWRRLESSGVAWITALPMGDPMRKSVSFHDVRCVPGHRREVAAALSRIPEAFTIEECHRDRDFMVSVNSSDPAHLAERVYPRFEAIPQLASYESIFCTKLHLTAADWEIGVLGERQRQALRKAVEAHAIVSAGAGLPASFEEIAGVLGYDGRASAAHVAEATGLHPATARRRLRQALGSGNLSIRCDVSHRAAGFPLICQWFARLPAADHDPAASELSRLGPLRLCASTTGRSNFTFMMWLRSLGDIIAVERAAAQRVPNLEIDETVVISHVPKRVGWRLDAEGRRSSEFVDGGAGGTGALRSSS